MRTPNCECEICGRPIYRRPSELVKVVFVCCRSCRSVAYKLYPSNNSLACLKLGREKGTNHLNGIPKSPESNIKRSVSQKKFYKDHPLVAIERGKKIRGENHYNWSGGVSRINTSVRLLNEHRKWMDAVKERDTSCVFCGATDNLEAHHLKPLSVIIEEHNILTNDEARCCAELWDTDNGISLCQDCHYEIHGRSKQCV